MRRYELAALLSAALTTVVAAFPLDIFFDELWANPMLKWTVVLLSAVTTILSTLKSRRGLEDLYRLREEGRVRVIAIQQKARLKLAQVPMTDEERYKYQEGIADEIAAIEQTYGHVPASTAKGDRGTRASEQLIGTQHHATAPVGDTPSSSSRI
jgi:hypothetical protein